MIVFVTCKVLQSLGIFHTAMNGQRNVLVHESTEAYQTRDHGSPC